MAGQRDDGADSPPEAADRSRRWDGRFSITVTLTTGICLLVLLSVGTVLGVGVWLAQKNTFELLSQNAHQGIASSEERVRQHLQPAEQQAAFVAARLAEGNPPPGDREAVGRLLLGALAAAPQIQAVMHIDPSYRAVLAGQGGGQTVGLFDEDYSGDEEVRARFRQMRDSPSWTAPIWRADTRESYLNLAHPLVGPDGAPGGAVVSVVSVREMSRFLKGAGPDAGAGRFILYGRDSVLAHPSMADDFPQQSSTAPLPRVSTFADPVLAAVWTGDERFELGLRLPEGTAGHVMRLDGDDYVFIYRSVEGFGPEPLIVGAYFPAVEVSTELRRMVVSLVAGVVALLLSLVAAILLGRRIARPVVRFSQAASRIRNLQVEQVENLPGSIFKELNDQAKAFNAMLQGLRWFELYVPKRLVERLVHSGEGRGAQSSSRELTVMFTDIAGFSTMSEGMTAAQVAGFVNSHFRLVAECIEAEGGTVDKFIGDSVMAFWGAPDALEETEARACRAARAIAGAIARDNRRRAAEGLAPVRLRIGVHTGEATVGNIGYPGRLNYTIIGDTVNIGQRLEQLAKTLCPPDTETAILISGDTAAGLGGDWTLEDCGRHVLKGRRGEVDVYRLT
jgi:class 3 adenylate cyclase